MIVQVDDSHNHNQVYHTTTTTMGFKKNIFLASALAACTLAAPVPDCNGGSNAGGLTAATLVTIAPKTQSCSGADFPEECADATKAAAALNKAFATYKITAKGEQAAIVAYELFESGDFKYKKNHFPGRPGQGTRSKSFLCLLCVVKTKN